LWARSGATLRRRVSQLLGVGPAFCDPIAPGAWTVGPGATRAVPCSAVGPRPGRDRAWARGGRIPFRGLRSQFMFWFHALFVGPWVTWAYAVCQGGGAPGALDGVGRRRPGCSRKAAPARPGPTRARAQGCPRCSTRLGRGMDQNLSPMRVHVICLLTLVRSVPPLPAHSPGATRVCGTGRSGSPKRRSTDTPGAPRVWARQHAGRPGRGATLRPPLRARPTDGPDGRHEAARLLCTARSRPARPHP